MEVECDTAYAVDISMKQIYMMTNDSFIAPAIVQVSRYSWLVQVFIARIKRALCDDHHVSDACLTKNSYSFGSII